MLKRENINTQVLGNEGKGEKRIFLLDKKFFEVKTKLWYCLLCMQKGFTCHEDDDILFELMN